MPDTSLMRVLPDDSSYLAQAQAEAAFYEHKLGFADAAAEPEGIVRLHYNRRYTGDQNVPWFEIIARYGPFEHGAVLGAGGIPQETRILETNPDLYLTVFDISTGPLENRERILAPRFFGRVKTQRADLNFVELREETYDVIVSASAMHHITNLEYLAAQIGRALKPGGYFFLHDYVGESRRRFAPEKKLVAELLYNRELVRQGRPTTTVEWLDGDDTTSPFCGIRSADILGVLRANLGEVDVRTAGGLWAPVLFMRDQRSSARASLRARLRTQPGLRKVMRALDRRREQSAAPILDPLYVQRLLDVSDRLTDAGQLMPANAFGIYRKRGE